MKSAHIWRRISPGPGGAVFRSQQWSHSFSRMCLRAGFFCATAGSRRLCSASLSISCGTSCSVVSRRRILATDSEVSRLRAWHFMVLLLKFIMAKKFMSLLAGMAVISGAATLFAQEGAKPAKTGEGTLMIDGKDYPLTDALAYETTINEEDVT